MLYLFLVISIVDEDVTFGLALTKKSLYHRNISQFTRTTLKSNISAALLRLVEELMDSLKLLMEIAQFIR